MPDDAPAAQSRICCDCHRDRPLSQFRPTKRDGSRRAYLCSLCHARRERVRRKKQRCRRRDDAISRFQTAITQAATSRRVEVLSWDMIRRYGGIRRFSALWHEHLTKRMDEHPGSRAVLMGFRALLRLCEVADAERTRRHHDQQFLSHEDLERTLNAALGDLLQARPELAVMAAQSAGWTVLPPES